MLLFSCRSFSVPFYIGTVIPFLVIYLFNWIIFIIIIASLIHKSISMKNLKDETSYALIKQQLVIALTLSVLFGLGWGIGLLATNDIHTNKTIRDLFASLFVLATSFHGLFIFIMHCLRSKDVKSVWKRGFLGITGKEFKEFNLSISNQIRQKGQTSSSLKNPSTNATTENTYALTTITDKNIIAEEEKSDEENEVLDTKLDEICVQSMSVSEEKENDTKIATEEKKIGEINKSKTDKKEDVKEMEKEEIEVQQKSWEDKKKEQLPVTSKTEEEVTEKRAGHKVAAEMDDGLSTLRFYSKKREEGYHRDSLEIVGIAENENNCFPEEKK